MNRMNDDTISRRAAIKAICEHGTELERRGITVLAVANHKQVTVDLLENLPAAERRGRWFIKKDVTFPHMVCSECKKPFYGNMNDTWNYCPNCGAKMEATNAFYGKEKI